ncbi:hypothetical protein R9X47_03700 [Wukongibacter baidiensis]|uniref:hypothetical protein n=1 Tax=Wukongibacter baidiensis TaxID=1723361 RepID=UPI003D7F80A8
MSDNWITIKCNSKRKKIPSEIRIDKSGKVFFDGELFDENNPKFRNYHIDIEKHGRVNTGEETRRMIESQRESKKGDTVVLKDIKDKEKAETTIVKY